MTIEKKEYMKAGVKTGIVILVFTALLSAFQWSQIPFTQGGFVKTAYECNKNNLNKQGRVNIRYHVVDQFGEPAVNYRFRVLLYSVKWYWWIFPGTREKIRFYTLRTDDKGFVNFKPIWSGYRLKQREVETKNYYLQRGDDGECGLKMQDINDFSKRSSCRNIDLQVIRHDPPEELIALETQLGQIDIRTDEEAPEDISVPFRLVMKGKKNEQMYAKYALSLRMTIVGAKNYVLWRKARMLEDNPKAGKMSYKVILEGEDSLDFALMDGGVDDNPIAPKTGYSKCVTFKGSDNVWKEQQICFLRNMKYGKPIYYRMDFRIWLDERGIQFAQDYSDYLLNPTGGRSFYMEHQPIRNP